MANTVSRGRQISSQIKKWRLEKNAKPEESLFMVQRRNYRRLNEPGKPDLKFRVRGQEHSAEDLARWETRSVTHQQDQGKNAEKWGEITAALRRDPSQPPGRFLALWSFYRILCLRVPKQQPRLVFPITQAVPLALQQPQIQT